MKKILLILLAFTSFASFAQAEFPEGIQITGGQPTNTTPAFITTSSINGVLEKIPSAYIEKTANKISAITGYSETLYPNEKATHDGLDAKLNISDLPSNLTLYATNVPSGVSTYTKWVSSLNDPDYNTTAVNISTGEIFSSAQLISGLTSIGGVITGNPGIINVTTVGNIRRTAGTGSAKFYFELYKRTAAGVETLLGVSDFTLPVDFNTYAEFSATAVWNDGIFTETDRIVIKFYGSRLAGGSNPTFDFQFGGLTPVRTIVPVPFRVVAGEYELKANKVSTLTASDILYPNNNAVIAGLALKANLASPTFTGAPLAPTATAGTNTTQIATTAFVTGEVSSSLSNVVTLTGTQLLNNAPKTFAVSSGTSAAVSINNTGSTTGFLSTNASTQIGAYFTNQSSGTGAVFQSQSTSSGDLIRIDAGASATGLLINARNNGVATFTLNKTGATTATSFINSTAPATNALLANGTTLANPISGTGTTGYFPKFTSSGVIGNSIVSESGSLVSVLGGVNATNGFSSTSSTGSGVTTRLHLSNTNPNNGSGTSILLGSSATEGNGNARIVGTAFSGNDFRSQIQLQTTTTAGVWNYGLFINEIGASTFGSSVTATDYKISALNTAPASATDTGTTGEIRITAGFIHVCIATNTWVRAALTTWL